MKPINCGIVFASLALVGLVTAGAALASAQDVYKVNYFDNNRTSYVSYNNLLYELVPDAKVRIDNPGLTYGNLCAMIYVFAADQQLTECCGCIETHNGLRKLSVFGNLSINPLTGVAPVSGVIKVVSAAVNGPACDPTANVTPKANLRVWVTHIQDPVFLPALGQISPLYPTTETESSDSPLGATELANLQAQCAFIHILGSGAGICTCGIGD